LRTLHSQVIYETNFNPGGLDPYPAGTVGEYDASTGATINSSFISSGLSHPVGIAEYGGNLFVANAGVGTVGEFDATTGATISTPFITAPENYSLTGIALSGGNVFVANS